MERQRSAGRVGGQAFICCMSPPINRSTLCARSRSATTYDSGSRYWHPHGSLYVAPHTMLVRDTDAS